MVFLDIISFREDESDGEISSASHFLLLFFNLIEKLLLKT
jgi:hypothetical protein